ncbi:MAG: 1-acyl-sn-glycerol-3-phosphate acyltransferase [Bacteroidales bacterium]|nr:1-acyl-sn-glycerol-3-phosphate acyltransferase [Bacteroidales bacterium]
MFDDIRPYYTEEIPAAMQKIADSEIIPHIVNYLMPGTDVESFRERLRKVRTTYEFQSGIISECIDIILKKTTSQFVWTGIENISEDKPYLYISNHRDIVLDAMLLQYLLIKENHRTSQITFGSNLMQHPFIVDFGKVNKMFKTERGGNRVEFYNNLTYMSKYIRHVVTENKESVWIAQRNGRTKDGLDVTDPAIIKMFWSSRRDDKIQSLAEMNITPVSVSYEWDPCDKLKTLELYHTKIDGKYNKVPGEDITSILTGIKQPKGKVNFHICKTLTENDLRKIDSLEGNYFSNIAKQIDEQINSNYAINPNNYIAHDIRSGEAKYANQYTDEQKKQFVEYMNWIDEYKDLDKNLLREIFLGIYANCIR